MTKHGKLIAEVVLQSHDHPTAEQIYNRIRERGTQISVATVYNNLKSLTEEGILRKITMDGAPDRFDKPNHHQHLVCRRCGSLADVELRDLTGLLKADTGLEVTSYDLRIGYLCDRCREELEQSEK